MPIPRRIIQTHRNESIQQELRQGWRALHPGYEYLFFNDAQCREFMAERAPEFLGTYDALPLPVQKADLFRYAAVYELGGFYADVDTVCCAPLHEYIDLESESLVVCPEMLPGDWPQGALQYTYLFCAGRQLGQWAFCAPARHSALLAMLERIRYVVGLHSPEQLAVMSANMRFTLELTGPHLFTRVVDEFLAGSRQGDVTVLPRLCWGASVAEQADTTLASQMKLRHLFEGSWISPQAKPARSTRPTKQAPPKVSFSLRY